MKQAEAFQSDALYLDAAKADALAAGGLKTVGHDLWSEMDPEDARDKLANALNKDHRQQLKYYELQRIKYLARRATGRSQLHALESKDLDCDLAWLTDEDLDRREDERLESLFAEVMTAMSEHKARRAKR